MKTNTPVIRGDQVNLTTEEWLSILHFVTGLAMGLPMRADEESRRNLEVIINAVSSRLASQRMVTK